jgi:hypothetical protein
MTKVESGAIGTSTPLESNKSRAFNWGETTEFFNTTRYDKRCAHVPHSHPVHGGLLQCSGLCASTTA